MSRIGKKPIEIPQGVTVAIDGQKVTVKGPKGELNIDVHENIKVELQENQIVASVQKETQQSRALWGLTRALIQNMVVGVTQGYEKKLEVKGIGYTASMEGQNLILKVGFSHPVKIAKEDGLDLKAEKNIITISGIDKEKVGNFAAKIRGIKKPEPYKGKGIRYEGEVVRKKLGKKAAKA